MLSACRRYWCAGVVGRFYKHAVALSVRRQKLIMGRPAFARIAVDVPMRRCYSISAGVYTAAVVSLLATRIHAEPPVPRYECSFVGEHGAVGVGMFVFVCRCLRSVNSCHGVQIAVGVPQLVILVPCEETLPSGCRC